MHIIRWLVALSTSPRQFGPSLAVSTGICAVFAYLLLSGAWQWIFLTVMVLGAIGYTLAEYVYHRWIAHSWMERYDISARHHDDPFDVFAAPWMAIAPVAFFVHIVIAFVMGMPWATAFMVGVSLTHLRQELLHWAIHQQPRWSQRWMPELAAHHWGHHQNWTVNYGVSTSVWDRVFGTKSLT